MHMHIPQNQRADGLFSSKVITKTKLAFYVYFFVYIFKLNYIPSSQLISILRGSLSEGVNAKKHEI